MLRQMGCSNIPSFCLGIRKRGRALLLQGGCACEVSQGRANNVIASCHSLLLDSSNLLQQALLELSAVPSDNGPIVCLCCRPMQKDKAAAGMEQELWTA